MQRYFVSQKEDQIVTLSDEDSYHFKTVMRGVPSDRVEIILDKKTYLAEVVSCDGSVCCKILEEKKETEEEMHVTIAQALVKEQKMDLILQKSCELGVEKIIPWKAERSVVKVEEKQEKKRDRWQKIVKSASEQSKSSFIPEVTMPMTIKELIQLDYDVKIVCTVNEKTKSLKKVLSNVKKNDRMIVVIGPEGGFHPSEEQLLEDAGFLSVSLGNRVLRTETASLFLLSCVKYELME